MSDPTPAAPTPGGLAAAVVRALASDGPLARALPSFESRPGQRAMAAAVAQIVQDGGILLVEAGTGTGKTLAYLLPAILSRQRVLISTGTRNLQEQILDKDLPALRDALGIPFTATALKGRGNYLCLHRFDSWLQGFRPNDPSEAKEDPRPPRTPAGRAPRARLPLDKPSAWGSDRGAVFLPVLQQWAARTQTGDRAEVAELPDDLPFWGDIAATSENCLGTDCPRYDDCFVTRARQRAAESDLVIVNHHLLCADAAVRQSAYGAVIPACSYAIFDEAHQIEDVATQYFGIAISSYRCEDLARDGERLLGAKLVADDRGELRRAIDRVRDRSRLFFEALQTDRLGEGHQADDRAAVSDQRVRVTAAALAGAATPGAALAGALDTLEATLALVRERTPNADERPPSPAVDALAVARRAGELRDQLRFLLRADDPDYVYYLERRGRGVFLRASPIDVSAIVRELLLDRMRGTVLTSATLAVEGSFAYIRRRLGITRALELRLPSEFDYARQAVLYLPRRMPDPRSPAFTERAGREIIEILRRSRGRAFVLFTSYAALRDVDPMVRAALDYPLFVQGEAPQPVLLAQFRSTPHAVLLATSSFWQGVDVMGEALSCVIVDRLPFASPADPITAARIEALTSRAEEPFSTYQVPLAILTLQQGLGRLIRHRQDRGVMAVLDPRLRTRGYGRRFLDSLPPAPVTHDVDAIERFFAG